MSTNDSRPIAFRHGRGDASTVFDLFDSESISGHLYALANVDPCWPIGAEALALRIPGIVAVRDDAHRMLRCSAHTWGPDGDTIWVRPRLPDPERSLCIAHECLEILFARLSIYSEHIERAARQAEAAVCAPRPAVQHALRFAGEDFPWLARVFLIPEVAALQRFSEVTETPVAVCRRGAVETYGPEWGWPPPSEIGRLARGNTLPRALRRHLVSDDRRAVALIAA